MKSFSRSVGVTLICQSLAALSAATMSSVAVSNAAELVVLTSQGAIPGVRELGAAFARATGHKVTALEETGSALEQRLANLDDGDIPAICAAARAVPPPRRQESPRPGHRAGLLRAQRPPDALRPLQGARHVRRLGSGRGRLQIDPC